MEIQTVKLVCGFVIMAVVATTLVGLLTYVVVSHIS
ncbi:hypothetical protein Pat9b_5813 (plasmid) [Pantoea sp. At-9b]|jgi:hypothetical protein|nr:hypothetical protein Pat9b_5813 [Pantoea sp. At-9b]